jgi:uncharacterized metal-binding protein YceD (DUF177 family)
MPVTVNLRHLEAHDVHLEGDLPAPELELDVRDELIEIREPLKYDIEVQKLEHNLLVTGSLRLKLDCKCARCLRPFQFDLEIDPWTVHLALMGEDAVPVSNDCIDLTPYIREDILLEFPQHPLCDAECHGLPHASLMGKGTEPSTANSEAGSSAWAELNKLKLKN